MKSNESSVRKLFIIALFLMVIVAYLPGINGALYYDDYSNLQSLSNIQNINDAFLFISNGIAGELGRPISLATFVPFHKGWPNNTNYILLFNITLHSINFLLIGFLSTLIIRRLISDQNKIFYISWSAAFLWAAMPLLASTSLISIQRMTSLSAFFMLMGLLIYVKSLKEKNNTSFKDLTLQLSIIFIFTTLAIFSKENGALLPAYALLIDILIDKRKNPEKYVKIRRYILLIPTLFIIFYILNIDWFTYSEHRGFTPFDRFLTQSVIILEYLKTGFLPQSPTTFSPFHDYYAIREFDLKTIFSIIFIPSILTASLFAYNKSRWILISILWYLNSHLLESTTIMLELYFEHRNYLAFYVFILAISYFIFTNKLKFNKLLIFGFISYIILMWIILFSVSSLWGDKYKAAEVWHNKHPGSARAVLHSVFIELGDDNIETTELNNDLIELQRKVRAISVLDKTSEICTDCLDTRLLALIYSCTINEKNINKSRIENLTQIAKNGIVNLTFTTHLFDLFNLIDKEQCNGIKFNELDNLLVELQKNERAIANGDDLKFLFLTAMIYESKNMYNNALETLYTAETKSIEALPILQYQVHIYSKLNLPDKALSAIERREKSEYFEEKIFQKDINEIRKLIITE